MSFFPNKQMPLTPKLDVVGSSKQLEAARITAEDYNKHDQEILAIEQYLISSGRVSTTGSTQSTVNTVSETENLIDKIISLETRVNNLLGPSGFCCISGNVHAGQRITFPEGIHSTYLLKAVTGSSIEVASTEGFPEEGILTILNKIVIGSQQGTFVENIGYSGLTETSFMNCERGLFGTTITDHGIPSSFIQGNANSRAGCSNVPPFMETCVRNYQGWRHLQWFQLFGLNGSYVTVVDRLLKAALYPDTIFKGYSGNNSRSDFYSLVSSQNMLGTNQDGTYYLRGPSGGAFSWSDSVAILNEALSQGMAVITEPFDFEYPEGAVPVFSGKLNVSVAPISIYNDILENTDGRDDSGFYLDTDGTIVYSSERWDSNALIFNYMCFGIGQNGIVKPKVVSSSAPLIESPESIYYNIQFQDSIDLPISIFGENMSSSVVKMPNGLSPSPSADNPTSIIGTLEEKATTYIKVSAQNESGTDNKTVVLSDYVPSSNGEPPNPPVGPPVIRYPTNGQVISMRDWSWIYGSRYYLLSHNTDKLIHTIEIDGARPMTVTVSSLPWGMRLDDDISTDENISWYQFWTYYRQSRTITLTTDSQKPGIKGGLLFYYFTYKVKITAVNEFGTDSVTYYYRGIWNLGVY